MRRGTGRLSERGCRGPFMGPALPDARTTRMRVLPPSCRAPILRDSLAGIVHAPAPVSRVYFLNRRTDSHPIAKKACIDTVPLFPDTDNCVVRVVPRATAITPRYTPRGPETHEGVYKRNGPRRHMRRTAFKKKKNLETQLVRVVSFPQQECHLVHHFVFSLLRRHAQSAPHAHTQFFLPLRKQKKSNTTKKWSTAESGVYINSQQLRV